MTSFSYIGNSSLMWAHYCRSYTGFVVKLNLGESKTFSRTKSKAITYQPLPPMIKLKWSLPRVLNDDFLFVKSAEWEYEKEYRYIFELDSSSTTNEFITVGNRDYVKIDPNQIIEVIVSDYTKVDLIKKLQSLSHIKIKKIRPLHNRYELKIN